MPDSQLPILFYLLILFIILSVYLTVQSRKNRRSEKTRDQAINDGLTQPASLHPVINPSLCLGSMACVAACPEGNILGIIRGKAELVSPSNCIGHGACAAACPHDAITLVFGTEHRGVDIPDIDPGFETSEKGIFISGELGGMGLVRNAILQGQQAVESIINRGYTNRGTEYDIVIVGAGPAGLSAALKAQEQSLKYLLLEQESPGGTIAHYPRGKVVMTSPVNLPLYGKLKFREASKEELMQTWHSIIDSTGLKITLNSRVESIRRDADSFLITSTSGEYSSSSVLLAMGRRGTPRKLGVDGEELPKVVYSLIDPEQYQGCAVLIVGGGDSALEAALSLVEQPGTTVTLSYRSGAFSRAKAKNRQRIEQAITDKMINVLYSSTIKEIMDDSVTLLQDEKVITLENDIVIINAGGILPTGFLKSVGIHVETKYGTA
jgi:thioredoxin reductase/ferredoxin